MEFDRSLIVNLPRSLNFLVNSVLQACNALSRGKLFSEKAPHVVKAEEFSSLFDSLRGDQAAIEKFRVKILKPIYDDKYEGIIDEFIDEETKKANDDFMKSGINFTLENFSLPISKIYCDMLEYSKTNPRSCHHLKILIGFYSTMLHTGAKEEEKESLDLISKNVNFVVETLEEVLAPQRPRGTGNMLQDFFKNFDVGHIENMLQKITGDENASKEFGEVFGKVTDAIKGGENPLEAMGDIIKNATEESQKLKAGEGENPGNGNPGAQN